MLTPLANKLISRRIYLDLANLPFQKVMFSLLTDWGYQVLGRPEAGGVALIEEGRPIPIGAGPIIRLTTSRYMVPDRICIPVSLEELWTQLESRFHRVPRNHIRRKVSLPATIRARGDTISTKVVSLSDWGCRFSLSRELAAGEKIEIEINVAKVSIALEGRVIYCMLCGEEVRRDRMEVGLEFEGIPTELRMFLRRNLILGYLERVREKLTREEFQEGVSYLNLMPRALESLGCLQSSRRGVPAR